MKKLFLIIMALTIIFSFSLSATMAQEPSTSDTDPSVELSVQTSDDQATEDTEIVISPTYTALKISLIYPLDIYIGVAMSSAFCGHGC